MSRDTPVRAFVDVGGSTWEAREVRGREELSRTYRFEVRFRAAGAGTLDPDTLVGGAGVLRLESERTAREVSAIVTEASVGLTARGAPEVWLVLEPRLALARHRIDLRVLRDRTAPQIVCEVLAAHGIAPELRLGSEYAVRPYTVQWRESDLAFASRLLEDEGIFYFFLGDGTLVLGDGAAAYEPLPGGEHLPYSGGHGLEVHREAVTAIGARGRLGAGKVTLRDFDPERPRLDMEVHAAGPWTAGPEHYDYPGEYADPGVGAHKARLIAESMRCESARTAGRTTSPRPFPGAVLRIDGAPPGVAEGKLAIVALDHDFALDRGGFSVAFEAVDGETVFRPARVTPSPRILNPMTGFVVGPPGEDIHTDAFGRVKVRFHWDRTMPVDDRASHWIPIAQDNTGHSSSIPRIGWEVLVHFLEGDPDRPVVLGRVFNADDPVHHDLPVQKTQSAIRSLSSPREPVRDDSGHHLILFEDKAGAEYIRVRAEKDQNVRVANDHAEHVMLNATTLVSRDEQIAVGRDLATTTGGDVTLETTRDQAWHVGGSHHLTVGGSLESSVTGSHSLAIGGLHQRRIGGTDATSAPVLKETVGGVILETSLKGNSASADKAAALIVGGAIVEVAKVDVSSASGLARSETIGGLLMQKAGHDLGARVAKKRALMVAGPLKISSKKEAKITAAKKVSISAESLELTAKKNVTLKVGDTVVTLGDGVVGITANKQIELVGKNDNLQGAEKSTLIPG